MALDLRNTGLQLLFTTIRIETLNEDGTTSMGTGCFFSPTSKGNHPYIITNKHVVENAVEGRLVFTLKVDDDKFRLGNKYEIKIANFKKGWLAHSNPEIDLCIRSLKPIINQAKKEKVNIYYKVIRKDIFPTDKQIQGIDVFEQVSFIGYPNNIYDTKHNLPIYRTGTTATHIDLDYCGRSVFLIDASVFPGSSGSPVFLYDSAVHKEIDTIVISPRLLFVGIISETIIKNESGELETIKIPTNEKTVVNINQMVDLGIVIKWTEVEKLIKEYEAVYSYLKTK